MYILIEIPYLCTFLLVMSRLPGNATNYGHRYMSLTSGACVPVCGVGNPIYLIT